jgi:hypothetical protein
VNASVGIRLFLRLCRNPGHAALLRIATTAVQNPTKIALQYVSQDYRVGQHSERVQQHLKYTAKQKTSKTTANI